MKNVLITIMCVACVCVPAAAVADHCGNHAADGAAPSADEQVKSLEQMCEENSAARAARHTETTLYERLGKEEGIHRFTKELVRVHLANDQVKHFFDGTDPDLVADRVARFMISGVGGPAVYKNRPTLPDSHRHMKLTNADFMVAGGDVIQAMQNLDYGQNEIDEVVCILVGLRDQVVLDHREHGKRAAHAGH